MSRYEEHVVRTDGPFPGYISCTQIFFHILENKLSLQINFLTDDKSHNRTFLQLNQIEHPQKPSTGKLKGAIKILTLFSDGLKFLSDPSRNRIEHWKV